MGQSANPSELLFSFIQSVHHSCNNPYIFLVMAVQLVSKCLIHSQILAVRKALSFIPAYFGTIYDVVMIMSFTCKMQNYTNTKPQHSFIH